MTSPVFPAKTICKFLIVSLLGYIIYNIIPLDILLAFTGLIIISSILLTMKWKEIKAYGLINYMSEKTKDLLLRKSILDVFSDLLYFPYISEIIKAFISAVIQKPEPQKLYGCFADLPADTREAIATKGILHLAPQKIENLMLKQDWNDPDYGKINTKWYNSKKYETEASKRPYKPSIKQKLINRIKSQPWTLVFILGLVTALASKKYGKVEIQKILARRGFEMGIILCVVSLVPLLMRKQEKQQIKQVKSQQ